MKLHIFTFRETPQYDPANYAGMKKFVKVLLRRYGLRCVNIEEKDAPTKRATRAKRTPPPVALDVADINKKMREPDWRR